MGRALLVIDVQNEYFTGALPIAKSKEMIQWADGRASFDVVPEFVDTEWGIVLD